MSRRPPAQAKMAAAEKSAETVRGIAVKRALALANPPPCGRSSLPHKGTRKPPESWKKQLNEHISKQGLKQSSQRLKIAEVILKENSHFTIQEVAERVRASVEGTGLATLYRTIALLVSAGILRETLVGEAGQTFYEVEDSKHHDHVVCTDCGHIFEFHDEEIEKLQDRVASKMGFTPLHHRHVVYAKCKKL